MSSSPVERLDEFFGPNAGYALELLERVQQPQPTAEPEEAVVGLRASAEVSAAAAAAALAQSIRLFGHRGARLDPLTEISAFERFIHRAYPGQTRFSIEGLGMLIPMLDEMIADAAAHGTRSILLGMAHRGRLNVLAHVLGKPYARILAEFEGREPTGRGARSDSVDAGWAGDVKYHAGARRVVRDQPADKRNG